MTKQAGRPKGYSPGLKRVLTHTVGEWSWNTNNLHKRIIKGDANECWRWKGSANHYGNIFGAYKNGKPQMTQANRLLYMEQTGESATDLAIKMTCGNHHCSNPAHFHAAPNIRSTKPKAQFYSLSISELLFRELLDTEREQIRLMVKEFATTTGADWELEYRWMRMPEENFLLAQIKYADIIQYLGVKKL